jgi:hypothetical protein
MKKLINKALSILFPFKELDPRPVYNFGDETHIEWLFRTNQLVNFVVKK